MTLMADPETPWDIMVSFWLLIASIDWERGIFGFDENSGSTTTVDLGIEIGSLLPLFKRETVGLSPTSLELVFSSHH
jgi:hypothetical protein